MLIKEYNKDILNFWFDNKEYKEYNEFWFDGSKDSYIIKKYSELLKELELEFDNYKNYENCVNYIKTIYDNETILSMIIVLDQFSRSIYRKDKRNIYKNDRFAFYLSAYLLEKGYDKKVSLSKRIFILMPYRHKKKSDLLDFVLTKIEEYKKELGDSAFLNRFKNATLASYTYLTDRILINNDKEEYNKYNEYKSIIDKNCHNYIEKISDTNEDINDTNENCLYKTMKSFINSKNIQDIGISLSGGVDSMVILNILSRISVNVYAMHIEYCNREESKIETELIKKYCTKLGVPLYIRKVNHMSRNSVDRKFYEEETRKIRFSTYQYLCNKHSISGWCLGHHKDDLSENVLMNICNGRNIIDLTVMQKESTIDDVILYRPLLDHPKSDIYDFAHSHFIPYLVDTTPIWSSRGVLRKKVLPVMKEQWPMIDKNLIEIGKQSEEYDYMFKNFILEPLKKDIEINKECNTVIMNLPEKLFPKSIWLNLFLYIFHGMSIHMISHKNLAYFIESFSRNYEKKNRFMFSNGCVGIFMEKKLKIIKLNKKDF